MKGALAILIIIITITLCNNVVIAYNDKTTHRFITEVAIQRSTLDRYLQEKLGIPEGLRTTYKVSSKDKMIIELLQDGSQNEDFAYRAYNHFWDPVRNKGLDDDGWSRLLLLSGPDRLIPLHFNGFGNSEWAMGRKEDGGPLDNCGSGDYSENNKCNDYSWRRARDAFFEALMSDTDEGSAQNFVLFYERFGRVLHLLQDAAVPAHTRNDMFGHLDFEEVQGWNFKNWGGNLYEFWIQKNHTDTNSIDTISTGAIISAFTNKKDYWDREVYRDGTNPDVTLATDGYEHAGLAEYSNANFLSKRVLFTHNLPINDKHYFLYPHKSSITYIPQEVVAEDGKIDKPLYLNKYKDGEAIYPYALAKYEWEDLVGMEISGYEPHWHLAFKFDEEVYKEYAKKLIPKTVGYTVGLINYFLRGNFDVKNLRLIKDRYGSINKLELQVKNTSESAGLMEYMNGGTIGLAYRYVSPGEAKFERWVQRDVYTVDGRHPINNAHVTLVFNNVLIPAGAKDISFTLVYRGKLGEDDDAVVGRVIPLTSRIAYSGQPTVCSSGQIYVYSVNPDGTDNTLLTDVSQTADGYQWRRNPTWSPDGRMMAYNAIAADNQYEIVLVDLASDLPYPDNIVKTLRDPAAHYMYPSFNQNGTKIVAERLMLRHPSDDSDLYDAPVILDVTTGNSSFIGGIDFWKSMPITQRPRWSPKGDRIVFEAYRETQGDRMIFNVWTIAPDGTGLARLTDESYDSRWPAWSPDGETLVFASKRAGGDNYAIWTMNKTGQNANLIYDCPAECWRFSYSPDGKRIVFKMPGPIYTIKSDGTELKPLDATPCAGDPEWSHYLFQESQ
jgi:Tol biopolymer transport system component